MPKYFAQNWALPSSSHDRHLIYKRLPFAGLHRPDCRLAVELVPAGLSSTGQRGSAGTGPKPPDWPKAAASNPGELANHASCAELDDNISTCRQWPPHDGGEQDSEAATAAPVARLRGGRRGRAAAPLLPRGPAARRARETWRSTASNGDAQRRRRQPRRRDRDRAAAAARAARSAAPGGGAAAEPRCASPRSGR